MNKNFIKIANVISLISLSINILILVLYFKTFDTYYIIAFVFGFIANFFANLIKNTSVLLFPSYKILYRPSNKAKCNLFNNFSGKQNGFPSGHMTSIVFSSLVLHKHINKYVILLLVLLMGWARKIKGCHNLFQIIGGILNGILWYFIFLKFLKYI
jgi:membrane-associated phospholipid phosphatase